MENVLIKCWISVCLLTGADGTIKIRVNSAREKDYHKCHPNNMNNSMKKPKEPQHKEQNNRSSLRMSQKNECKELITTNL